MTKKKMLDSFDSFIFGLSLTGDGSALHIHDNEDCTSPYWLHIDYSEGDSAELLRQIDVPDSIAESLLRFDTRPRTMAFGDGLLIILRAVNANPGESPDDMVSIRFWLQKNRLISVRQRRVFSAQDLKKSLENGSGANNLKELVSDFLEKLADRVADYVDLLEEKIDLQEGNIEADNPNDIRKDVSKLRREAALVRRFLAPQRDALDTFSRQSKELLDIETSYFIHEQSDRIVRYVEDLDLLRERAMVLQEELMSRMAQEQNARMYVLSIVAAIFLPISFITGLFGMNVSGLPGLENPIAFILVAVLMTGIVSATLLFFRYKKWL